MVQVFDIGMYIYYVYINVDNYVQVKFKNKKRRPLDRFQINMSNFSTRALILVN